MGSPILALDVGTSSCHCLLANGEGSCLAAASSPIAYHTPRDGPELAREFDPDQLLATLGDLVAQVLGEADVAPGSIDSIAITSQRQGLVLLDSAGAELACSPNIDLRAVFEGAFIDEQRGDQVYRTTGHTPSLIMAPARLAWFEKHDPGIFQRTDAVLSVAGWLMYRLTGRKLGERCMEGEAGLLNISSGARCHRLLDSLGFPRGLLPSMPGRGAPRRSVAGPLAQEWGLKKGSEVILAGPDTQCGLLGMGLTQPGEVGALLGWSGAIQAITSAPCLHPDRATWAGRYLLDDLWVAEANLGEVGSSYTWLKDLLLGADTPISQADDLAAAASEDGSGILACLGPGPESAFTAGLRRGGLLFPTPFSYRQPTAAGFFRAALENIAFSAKANLSCLDQLTGQTTDLLHIGGGMARSNAMASILADVLGLPVRRSRIPQATARGAILRGILQTRSDISPHQLTEIAGADHDDIVPSSPAAVARYEGAYHEWIHVQQHLDWE